MTFDRSSAPVVRLAWERGLNLPTGSVVSAPANDRITEARQGPALTFIRLWEQSILIGPEHLLDTAESLDDDELSDHSVMLRLTKNDGGRGLGTRTLYYADDLALHQPTETVHVSTGTPEAQALELMCPPDDLNDVGLASRDHKFTLMAHGESDAGPVACSAYSEYQGLLAELGTLVAPAFRRQGLGALATGIAAHEALAAGLVVQWQADINNVAAHALATSLGFSVAGLQTRVWLQSDQNRRK